MNAMALLFALLVGVPGVQIPLYVIHRMNRLLSGHQAVQADRTIARITIGLMVVLMVFSVVAAAAVYRALSG
jgi:hypothetical protein